MSAPRTEPTRRESERLQQQQDSNRGRHFPGDDANLGLKLFETLAESNSDIILSWLPDGACDYASERFYQITGLAPDSARGDGWAQGIHPSERDQVLAFLRTAIADGISYEGQFRLVTCDGEARRFVCRTVPVKDHENRVICWLGSASDVQDLLDSERSLEQTRRHQDEFLSILSHELLNTLVPIQNAIELLRLANKSPESQRAIDLIENQLRNSRRLLDELRDASRLIRGKAEIRKSVVELAPIIARAVEMARPHVDRFKHQLTVELPELPFHVHGDSGRLAQAITHLVTNAAQCTPDGGRIRVVSETEADEVVVAIEDNGIGIDAERLAGIFDLFARFDTPLGRAYRGFGVGLAVARKIIELHGGRIDARSQGQNTGSVFRIRLPRAANAQPANHKSTPCRNGIDDLAPQRILVVGQDQEFADEWSVLLRITGHDVRTAPIDARTVEIACQMRPTVISIEIDSAAPSCCDLARELRKHCEPDKALIIALTPARDAEAERLARELGCDAALAKPVRTRDFLQLIAQKQADVAQRSGPS